MLSGPELTGDLAPYGPGGQLAVKPPVELYVSYTFVLHLSRGHFSSTQLFHFFHSLVIIVVSCFLNLLAVFFFVKRLVALSLPLRSMKVAGRCRFCCCVTSRLYFLLFLSGTAGARQRGEHMDGLLRRFQSKGLLLRRVWAELAMSTERG